jgi:hypothetical protein
MAKILTKADILAVNDRTTELVDVPEWGGAVYVRTMTAAERDREERRIYDAQQGKKGSEAMANFRARFLALTLVNEDGEPLFSMKEVDQLASKSFAVISRLFDVSQRINGVTKEEIEAIEGNS